MKVVVEHTGGNIWCILVSDDEHLHYISSEGYSTYRKPDLNELHVAGRNTTLMECYSEWIFEQGGEGAVAECYFNEGLEAYTVHQHLILILRAHALLLKDKDKYAAVDIGLNILAGNIEWLAKELRV